MFKHKKIVLPIAFMSLAGSFFVYDSIIRKSNPATKLSADLRLKWGDEKFHEAKFDIAAAAYEAVWRDEALPQAAAALATLNYYLYRNEEARKWLDLVPESDLTNKWKSDFHLLLGQKPRENWISLRPLIACQPPSSMNPAGANLLLSQFDSKNSDAYLAQASDLSPDCSEVQWLVAEKIMQNRGIPEALEFVMAELHKRPNAPGFMAARAQLYIKKGDLDKGKALLQDAIRSDSKNLKAYLLLGKIAVQQGTQPEIEANKQYRSRRSVGFYPVRAYEMYTKLDPKDPYGYMLAADEYYKVRDFGAASKNYMKALSISPRIPGANLQMAVISRQSGDLNAALNFVNKELELYSDSKGAARLRASIQKQKSQPK